MARVSSVARRYAQAYFDLAEQAGRIPSWGKELAAVSAALTHPEVAQAVTNPRLPLSQRVRLGLDLLDGASTPARNLARILIERRRTALLPEMLTHYELLADRASGVLRAEVVTAVPGDPDLVREVTDVLSKRFGRQVRTSLRHDPAILGGVVIRVGDRVIDDSVRTHLQQLQASLA